MFPHPNPPIGEPASERALYSFLLSGRRAGLGRRKLHRQAAVLFKGRGSKGLHETTVQRALARIDAELALRAWFETDSGRSELAAMADRLASSDPPSVDLASQATRLVLVERLTRAATGQALPEELDALAHEFATLRRRPGRKPNV